MSRALQIALGLALCGCGSTGSGAPRHAEDATPPVVVRARLAAGGTMVARQSMGAPRAGHRMLLLGDGRVAAAGGFDAPTAVELYDPTSDKWKPAAPAPHPHAAAAAVVLADGRILLAGGERLDFEGLLGPRETMRIGDHASVDVLDPETGHWSTIASMKHPRQQASAVLLGDGKVMVVGGLSSVRRKHGSGEIQGPDYPLAAEIWDPATDTWTEAGDVAEADETILLAPRDDGSVLLVGRVHGAQLWRADEGWRPIAMPPGHGVDFGATPLADGRVLLTGGWLVDEQRSTDAVTAWDPTTSAAVSLPPLAAVRSGHLSLTLADGSVLVVGGQDDLDHRGLATAERFDPARERWLPAGSYPSRAVGASGVALADGTALLAGGQRVLEGETMPIVVAAVERWWPGEASSVPDAPVATPMRWEPTAGLRFARCDTAVALGGGAALFLGGGGNIADPPPLVEGNRAYEGRNTVERYDAASARFRVVGRLSEKRAGSTAVTLADGRVLVLGGGDAPASAELWDPSTNASHRLPDMAHGRYEARAVALADGSVLIAGTFVTEAERFDPASETFVSAGAHPALGVERGALNAISGGRALYTTADDTLLWEPGAGWRKIADPRITRAEHTATTLADGRVLLVGGGRDDRQSGIREAELFDPATLSWQPAGALAQGSTQHVALLLGDGRVAVLGGFAVVGGQPTLLDRVEIFDPAAMRWQAGPKLATPRAAPGLVHLPDGSVLLAGGRTPAADDLMGACATSAEHLTL
jgi:hypothetical protein